MKRKSEDNQKDIESAPENANPETLMQMESS